MSRAKQNLAFGLGSVLALLTGAMSFAASLAVLGNHLFTWFIFSITALWLIAEVLTLSIPESIRSLQIHNCIRRDGSWSKGREFVERLSLGRFRRTLATVLVMVAFPTLFALWMFNREVIPLDIGFDAVTSMRGSTDASKANLVKQEARFDSWKKESSAGLAISDDSHKRLLWNSWPVVVAIGIAWICIVGSVVARSYFAGLKQLRKNIVARAEEYYWRDMSREPRMSGG